MSTHEFQECPTCEAKPGMPMLCESCIHNGDVIHELKDKLRTKSKLLEIIRLACQIERGGK